MSCWHVAGAQVVLDTDEVVDVQPIWDTGQKEGFLSFCLIFDGYLDVDAATAVAAFFVWPDFPVGVEDQV
jgi:hypothetical protein